MSEYYTKIKVKRNVAKGLEKCLIIRECDYVREGSYFYINEDDITEVIQMLDDTQEYYEYC